MYVRSPYDSFPFPHQTGECLSDGDDDGDGNENGKKTIGLHLLLYYPRETA